MKIIIEIPDKEFGQDIADKFQDFFKRLQAETKEHLISNTNLVCGNYELETIEMFLNAFKEMKIIPDNATIGDMIKTFFPNIIVKKNRHNVILERRNPKHAGLEFTGMADINWWNTPHKEESK